MTFNPYFPNAPVWMTLAFLGVLLALMALALIIDQRR